MLDTFNEYSMNYNHSQHLIIAAKLTIKVGMFALNCDTWGDYKEFSM
jgi:hypothetical protein